MMLPHRVVIKDAPLVADGKGNLIRDWVNAVSTDARGFVQPVSSNEQNLNQDRVVSRWQVFLEPGADMASTSRLVHNLATYQVDGEVQANGDGSVVRFHHAYLKRVSGA